MEKQSMNQLFSLRPGQPKRGCRGEDTLDPVEQSRTSHRRNGSAQWRPSRSNEADSGDDDDEEGRDSSPQPQAAKRRKVHAPEHGPQDSSSVDQPGTTSRPANAVSRSGRFGRNEAKAPRHDFFSLPSQKSNDFDDEDEDEDEDDEDDEADEPSSPEASPRELGRRGRPPGSKNKKPPKVAVAGPPKRAGRPPGSKNKKPKVDRTLTTSSVTLVNSGSAEPRHRGSDPDPGDSAQGRPLPTPAVPPKDKSRKTIRLDRAGPPPLCQSLGGDGLDGIDIGQLMVDQPCSQHIRDMGNDMQWMASLTKDDLLVLEKAVTNNPNLPRLFQVLWTGFNCRLYDLLKFGLWPDVTLPGEVGRSNTMEVGKGKDKFTVVNPYIAKDLTNKLVRLAVHPIWLGDVDRLRYVLMYAVYCRLEGHDAPILPILPLDADFFDGVEASPEAVALLRYKLSQKYGIASHGDIKLLCDEMDKDAKPKPPKDEMARSLFLLRTTDINAIIKALDQLESALTRYKLYQPTNWYYDEWDKRELDQWPRLKKSKNPNVIPQHLTDSVLRWRADHRIREALEGVEGQYLYDICEEHCPLTARCLNDIKADEEGGPTQSQLDVVRGLVRPRNGLHLESEAWRVPDSDYTPLAPNVKKKAGPTGTVRPNAISSTAPVGATYTAAVSSGDGAVRPEEVEQPPRLDGQPSDIFDDSEGQEMETASQSSGTLV